MGARPAGAKPVRINLPETQRPLCFRKIRIKG